MRNFFLVLLPLSVLILLSGCAYNSERAAKMAGNGPKTTQESDAEWYALCTDQTPGGHVGPWRGPARISKEWAIRDAASHEREYPGHHAQIKH